VVLKKQAFEAAQKPSRSSNSACSPFVRPTSTSEAVSTPSSSVHRTP